MATQNEKPNLAVKPQMAPQKGDDNKPNPQNNVMLHVGMTINGFEILKLIGQGKFSYVFKARRTQDKMIIALKLIKIFDMENEKQRDACLKEVQLHQVSIFCTFCLPNPSIDTKHIVFRQSEHREVLELVH